jgi:hypothetical protein
MKKTFFFNGAIANLCSLALKGVSNFAIESSHVRSEIFSIEGTN